MQVLGIIDIVWLGRNVPVEKGAKLRLGGIKNNAVTYGRKVARSAEFQGSEVSAKTHLEKGARWRDQYSSEVEGELQVICDTGQTYTFPDAFLEGDIPSLTGGEGGSIELKWAAGDYLEIVA